MRLALYQPDIPQNTGTILRMAACLDVPVDIIGPAGFDLSDRALRRAGLDYLDHVEMTHHLSFVTFCNALDAADQGGQNGRLILLTTKAEQAYTEFDFAAHDILMMGRESAGVPPHVHERADVQLKIPMQRGIRSLNIAISAAMVLGEALRQTDQFPVS